MQHAGGSFSLPRRFAALGAVVALAASCSSSNDSSSTAATSGAGATTAPAVTTPASTAGSAAGSAAGSGDVCADREALRSSVAALKDVDLVAEGTNGATAAISAVKDDLAALRASAGADLQPQVQAVQDDVDQLETAVANLDSGGASQAVAAVSSLVTSAGKLLDSLESGACGQATTSTT